MYKSISDELSWWCPGLCAVWDLPPKAGRGWMDIVWIVTIIVNHVSLWSVLLFSWDLIHYIHTGFADHIIDIRCYWVARLSFIGVMITATSVRQSGVIWKLVLYHPTCLLSENIPSNHQEIHQLMIEQVPKFQKCQASVQDVQASLKKGVLFDMSWTIDNGRSSISHSPKLFKLSFDDVISASAGLPPLRRIHVQHPEHQQDFQ